MSGLPYVSLARVGIFLWLLIMVPIFIAFLKGRPFSKAEKRKIKAIRISGICFIVLLEVFVVANPIGIFF